MDYSEVHLPNNWFRTAAGLTGYEIDELGKKYSSARANDEGVPVGGLIKALNEERKKISKIHGTKINQSDDEIEVELALKQENVLSKKITNQTKLSLLIPKEEASERVKGVLRILISLIKNAIKNSAPRLIKIEDKRGAETVMTEEWNDCVELLRTEAKVISWEQDGTTELLGTRLKMLERAGESEFVDTVKGRINNAN